MIFFMKKSLLTMASFACLQALILGNANTALSSTKVTSEENLEQLIKTRSCRGCDLSGLTLNRLDLSGVDLEGADLSLSKLHLTNLSGANLKNTKLKGTAFGGADLGGADLRGADLQDTSLDNAYLGEALLDDDRATSLGLKGSNSDMGAIALAEDTYSDNWWSRQPKEKKLFYTTVSASALIAVWGMLEWDYGSAGWNTSDEGWFGKDTKYGGADKLGHFWSTYALSDGLTGLYKSYGYDSKRANLYAAFSAWAVQAFMEVADATSETQGFSYEDMVMNTAGALTSVLMERYPELDRKIDFRVEYIFNVPFNGLFDDYSNQFYSMVLKLDGFDAIENTFLKYVEFHGGYYTRGYDSNEVEKNRSLYAGISFNFSRLLNQNGWNKTGKVLEYIQVPYTVLKASHDLD